MDSKKTTTTENQPHLGVDDAFTQAVNQFNAENYHEADKLCTAVIRAIPDHINAINLLEAIDKKLGRRHQSAEEVYQTGVSFQKTGRLADAVDCFTKAIALQPDLPEAHYHLGLAFSTMGNYEKAVEYFKKAVELRQDYLEALCAIGQVLTTQNVLAAAREWLTRAIAVDPGCSRAYFVLGLAYAKQGMLAKAINSYEKAIETDPDIPEYHINLCKSHVRFGDIAAARKSYDRAVSLSPNNPYWHSSFLVTSHYSNFNARELFEEHKRWNDLHTADIKTFQHIVDEHADPEKKLRVGFVSADFRTHSVGYFLESLFCSYNKDKMAFYCYYDYHCDDEMTHRLRGFVDAWRSIHNKSDQYVANLIREDNIDILVDLAGHSFQNNIMIFAMKPAPIQVTWLGYPNTTGLTAMDYRLTDQVADPVGLTDPYHSEKLVRLPNGFLCYQPPADAPDVNSLPAREKEYVKFGSFNDQAKISTELVKIWAEILRQVPNSKLILKNVAMNCAGVRKKLVSVFEKSSLDSNRLLLLRKTHTNREHLAKYGRVDIGLDTFPYNGTTTTCEALWMGVPVIALHGADRHVSRVGMSILTNVGLDELIARDTDDYIEKAVALANDVDRLENLRSGMRNRLLNSPLCDPKGFAVDFENAVREMWVRRCNNGR